MATTITFTATLADGTQVSRTSGTMAYTHSVNGVTWHKSLSGAAKQQQANNYGPIVEVVATKVNGKVDATDREFYEVADTAWTDAQRQAILDLIDAKLAPKPAKAPRKAKGARISQEALDVAVENAPVPTAADREAALAEAGFPTRDSILAGAVEAAELDAEAEATTPAEVDAEAELPAVEVAPAPAPAKAPTKKQALGALVHAAARSVLEGQLPEGLDAAEAESIITKWLQYIPTAANPGGWQPKA